MTNKKLFRLSTHKLCFFLVDCIFGFLSAFNPRQTTLSLTLTFRTKTELITCLLSEQNTSLRRRLHKQYILMKIALKVKLDKVLKEIWIIWRKCFWIINAEKGGEDEKRLGSMTGRKFALNVYTESHCPGFENSSIYRDEKRKTLISYHIENIS